MTTNVFTSYLIVHIFPLSTQLFLYGQDYSIPRKRSLKTENFEKTLTAVPHLENAFFVCKCGRTKRKVFQNDDVTSSVSIPLRNVINLPWMANRCFTVLSLILRLILNRQHNINPQQRK